MTRNDRVRCDGCGIISSDRDGYYRRDHRLPDNSGGSIESGNISSHGRDCEHDLCDACDATAHEVAGGACPKCGAKP